MSAVVAFVALAAAGVAAAAIGLVWSSTRPPRPSAGAPSMDLGPEPPAVVDLLTGGFAVDDDAVPATLVDLAARGWFDIDETGGAVRLTARSGGRGDLTRYEDRVRRHVEAKAVGGTTPAQVLTIGPDGVSERWWRGFAREVTTHARDLGLCRRRYHLRHLATMWVPLGVGWVAVGLLGSSYRRNRVDVDLSSPAAVATSLAWVAVLGLTVVATRISRSDAQAETPAGMEAASRWLGVRDHMLQAGSFEEAPAASVAVWDRNLAYATAMGLAPVVQRQLPFETEHDRHAWSHVTGHWRRVKVRYLSLRPGWGKSPWSVALGGALQAAVYGLIAYAGLQVAGGEVDLSDLPEPAQEWLPLAGLVVFAMAAAGALFGAVKVVLGVLDLFPRRVVEGEVVRARELRTGHRLPKVVQWLAWSGNDEHGQRRDLRRRVRHHVAIDDGTDDSIVAHQVRSSLFRSVRQGSRVRAKVSPLLGYVSEITELSPPPRQERAVAHGLVEDTVGQVAEGAGALVERLTAGLAATPEARAAFDQALDERGDDGLTARERLQQSTEQARRAADAAGAAGPSTAGGASLLGGLLGGITDAMEQLAGAGSDDPTDEQGQPSPPAPPPPVTDGPPPPPTAPPPPP